MWRYALRRLASAVPILLALSCRPSILLADEPTTALDVTVQIQIILLLRRLQRELGMAVIFVTHDVGVSVEIADRLAVMYAGRFVESGPTGAVIRRPRHPYTEGLLDSTVTTERGRRLPAIPGAPPDLRALPPGCAFAPRCAYAEESGALRTYRPSIGSPPTTPRAASAWPTARSGRLPRRSGRGGARLGSLGILPRVWLLEPAGARGESLGLLEPIAPGHHLQGQNL